MPTQCVHPAFLRAPALLLSEQCRTHSEYTIGRTKLALMNGTQCLRSPIEPANKLRSFSLSVLCTSPRRIARSSAEAPELLAGKHGERHCKNIDWKTTSLIKETLGLWFWGAYSTNFPNQPDILALLCEVPWGSTEGFVFLARETSIVRCTRSISRLDFWGWKIHPDTQCLQLSFLGPGSTCQSEWQHQVFLKD